MLTLVSNNDPTKPNKSIEQLYEEFLSIENGFQKTRLLREVLEKGNTKYIGTFLKYLNNTGKWKEFFDATDKWYIKGIIAIFVLARNGDDNNSLGKYLDNLNPSQLRYCYESVEKDYKIDGDDSQKIEATLRQIKVKLKFREVGLREA